MSKNDSERIALSIAGKPMPTAQQVVERVSSVVFDKQLVTNVFRGHLVEAMLSLVISPAWTWTSEDYASWDFQNSSGVRLEVKQSALKQSWTTAGGKWSKPSFDIAPRAVHWIDGKAVTANARAADIYIFSLHSITDSSADHRDPTQWQFYVLSAQQLPDTQRISLGRLQQLVSPIMLTQVPMQLELESDIITRLGLSRQR